MDQAELERIWAKRKADDIAYYRRMKIIALAILLSILVIWAGVAFYRAEKQEEARRNPPKPPGYMERWCSSEEAPPVSFAGYKGTDFTLKLTTGCFRRVTMPWGWHIERKR